MDLTHGGNLSDHFANKIRINCAELTFDSTGDVQAGLFPIGQFQIHLAQLGCDGHDEEISGPTAMTHDHRWSDFDTAQVREWNGQQDQIIS